MPFILKEPADDSPGIIIFTHKEQRWLGTGVRPVVDALRRLRERYVFGMHWGAYHANVDPPSLIDFHLAGPGTVTFARPVRRFPLCSRNFTPACFRAQDVPKFW